MDMAGSSRLIVTTKMNLGPAICILNMMSAQVYSFCLHPCHRRPRNQLHTVPDHDQYAETAAGQHQLCLEHLDATTSKASRIPWTGPYSFCVFRTACCRWFKTSIETALPITRPGKVNTYKTQGT
jgi:hypothetical protein